MGNVTKAELEDQLHEKSIRIDQLEQALTDASTRAEVLREREMTDPTLLAIHGCLTAIEQAARRAHQPEADHEMEASGRGNVDWFINGERVGWHTEPTRAWTAPPVRGVDVAQVIAYLQRQYAAQLEPDPNDIPF